MSGTVVLDISRLLSRADRSTPTGIDRVEQAYARHLIDTEGDRLRFAALDLRGRIALLPRAASVRFVERTERLWDGGARSGDPGLQRRGAMLAAAALVGPGGAALRAARGQPRPSYLLLSHHHLDSPRALRRFLRASGARLVTLVHDLIPIELPEYNRTGHDEKHGVRMTTAAELSDAVIVNSDGTGAGLAPFLARAGRSPPLVVAHLGVHERALRRPAPPTTSPEPPYFVIVSTIEPRKNHLLLFNVWRRLAAELGPATPHLHVVGHRGWHNEVVFDVLDRSTSLRPHVTEHRALSDAAMADLLGGARAVLMPSFAEGYGLPVAEALSAGVPVVCSDLATLRDVGGGAPDYLDPLDGPAWSQVVRDYADPGSPRRRAQVERMAAWRPPTWARHFALVDPHLRDPG